jgi:predicted transcriptional regulator
MDFKQTAKLGALISKPYAEDFLELLVNYQDISASEAASRLGLHIRTAQDFLETLESLEIVSKEEVSEGKRPYFRYTLQMKKIALEIDLTSFAQQKDALGIQSQKIREKKNAGARFSLSRDNASISNVSIWTGDGRQRKERRINLTASQGKFLFHLPFPTADHLSVDEIMHKADIEETLLPELIDIVELLERYEVIEAL